MKLSLFSCQFKKFWKYDPCLYQFLHWIRGHRYTRRLILRPISAARPQIDLCTKNPHDEVVITKVLKKTWIQAKIWKKASLNAGIITYIYGLYDPTWSKFSWFILEDTTTCCQGNRCMSDTREGFYKVLYCSNARCTGHTRDLQMKYGVLLVTYTREENYSRNRNEPCHWVFQMMVDMTSSTILNSRAIQ